MKELNATSSAGRPAAWGALAALAAAYGLAGCGGTSLQATSAAKPSSSASAPAITAAAAATSTAATSSAQSQGANGLAAPGAAFKFGETATLAYQSDAGGNSPTYKVAVTVQAPQRGTLADFNGIQLDSGEKAGTPAYVEVKLTNLGPGSINTSDDDPSIELEGVDNTDSLQDNVSFIGTFPRCPENTAPNPWPAGESFSTCLTFLVPGGINKVGYVGSNTYLNTPVMWAAN
jgi:hypothetical protein